MRKGVIFFCFLMVVYACADKGKSDVTTSSAATGEVVDGGKIFKTRCELCHGSDGKLGANGSKDLTVSDLDLNERIAMITKGKGAMTPFESILSLSEIKAVAEYSMTLKK